LDLQGSFRGHGSLFRLKLRLNGTALKPRRGGMSKLGLDLCRDTKAPQETL
jgi:hypothetical protein